MKLISAVLHQCGSFTDIALEVEVKGKRHKGSVSLENDGRDGEYEFEPPLPPEDDDFDDDFWEKLWDNKELSDAIEKQCGIGYLSWETFSPQACRDTTKLSTMLKECGIEHSTVPYENNGGSGNVIIIGNAALVIVDVNCINVFKGAEKPYEIEFPDFANPGFDPKKWAENL